MTLDIKLARDDIHTQIQGDNFFIHVGEVRILLTKEAMRTLVKDYVEITVGDEKEIEQLKEYAATQAIIEKMPHLRTAGSTDEIYCANHLPTFAKDIKVNFDKGFDYFKKLILQK